MLGTGFAVQVIGFCLLTSQLEHHWDTELPEVVASPLVQMRWEDTLHSPKECESSTCMGMGKLGSNSGKIPHLRILQVCIPPNSLPRMYLHLVLQVSKPTGWTMQVWTWFAKTHVRAVASPSPVLYHSQIPSGWASDSPERSLWYKINVGTPTKLPTSWRMLIVSSGLSFSIVRTRSSEETSLHMVLCWSEGGAMWSVCSPYSYPSNAVCQGLWGAYRCFTFNSTF